MMPSRPAGSRRAPRSAAPAPAGVRVTRPGGALPPVPRAPGRLRRLQSPAPAALRARILRELRARPAH